MSIPGFDLAQARYDGATPPSEHDCPNADEDCQCAERDADARDDALLARQEEREGR